MSMELANYQTSERSPLPVVIIGNGPSGICLSYLLSGYTPYVKEGAVHPNPLLQRKLEEFPHVPITQQDLEYLSEGLEGRSSSPAALLFDTLLRPDTDFLGDVESVLSWTLEPERAIPHLVLGRGPPGGAWNAIAGSMITLSRGDWMGLPDLSFQDWMRMKRRNLRNDRSTAGDILNYYQYYVKNKILQNNFVSGAVVNSVVRMNESEEHLPENKSIFQVSGFIKNNSGIKQNFCVYAKNVVLATGTYDSPLKLSIQGEDLPFVSHQISALEEAVKTKKVHQDSDPVLIIGAGLTAADAILLAHHYNIPVIHAFRRRVNDPGLIFNQLPQVMYPEYHKVYQMMKEQSVFQGGPYEGYMSLPEHHAVCFNDNKKCIFRDKCGQHKAFSVSMILILIGSKPNLSFLPNNGKYLSLDTEQPFSSKRNPLEIDPFTYECLQEKGLYAVGPLAGDYFVRFVQGGALAVANSLLKSQRRPP
ncbi:PREDICTED: oxidative stress-induced growth inhibitor 1 [Nanorana parkeri]|uniref:oxidative stress-induced growth inhibitor 1 n=1 Tax=Nanorana parkeri TaxID=125878 RepID=UPI000854B24E|nr:PREDICTED: oxidative stress-induced growth inhibitor 1 [Nanorana parkeri]